MRWEGYFSHLALIRCLRFDQASRRSVILNTTSLEVARISSRAELKKPKRANGYISFQIGFGLARVAALNTDEIYQRSRYLTGDALLI